MQMLIAELQNQDPTQPMSSQDLLGQLATMSQLQSTTDLDTALQANTTNQQLSIGASFIGKTINGTDATATPSRASSIRHSCQRDGLRGRGQFAGAARQHHQCRCNLLTACGTGADDWPLLTKRAMQKSRKWVWNKYFGFNGALADTN